MPRAEDELKRKAKYPEPVTFRPRSSDARALLEAVATVRGTSVSKFVAEAAERYAFEVVRKMGKDEFAAQLREIEERQQRMTDRLMASLDEDESLDAKPATQHNSVTEP